MKIGILGTGVVGQTLGSGLIKLGHEVKLGSREGGNEKVRDWIKQAGQGASGGTFTEAVTFGEVIILATLWGGTENALQLAGPENFAGKVVVDATNPLNFGPEGPVLAVGFTSSGGELVQQWLPQARVVKALNTITAALMVDPKKLGDTPDMFICGNDEAAKKQVTSILEAFGWPVIDLGNIQEARLIEPLGMLWIKVFIKTQSWQHAFKLIRPIKQAN